MIRSRFLSLLAVASLALCSAAQAATVTVTLPTPVNAAGQPISVGTAFIVNPDGTVSRLGTGAGSLATGQVSAGTGSTLIAAARPGRLKITLTILAANTCAFGNTGVAAGTGVVLPPTVGATITLDTSAAIYAACNVATTVSFVELY